MYHNQAEKVAEDMVRRFCPYKLDPEQKCDMPVSSHPVFKASRWLRERLVLMKSQRLSCQVRDVKTFRSSPQVNQPEDMCRVTLVMKKTDWQCMWQMIDEPRGTCSDESLC